MNITATYTQEDIENLIKADLSSKFSGRMDFSWSGQEKVITRKRQWGDDDYDLRPVDSLKNVSVYVSTRDW